MRNLNISSLAVMLGAFLVLTIAVATGISIKVLHDKAVEDWSKQTKSIALILSENTEQQITSAQLALDAILERIKLKAPADDAALRQLFANEETFRLLLDKAASSPQIDVATIVAANGDVLNFTRKWPPAKINLADRDYFLAHRANPALSFFISTPVRNKGNGKWTFYISRRLNTPKNQFLGVVIIGISTDYYSDFYSRISRESNASITLLREDFTIMARWPINEAILGKRNTTGSTYHIVHDLGLKEGVEVTNSPRKSANDQLGHPRMGAVRVVKKYPMIVNYTIDEDVYLGVWRQNTHLIVLVALGSILAIIFSFTLLIRALKRREQDLLETIRLKQEAEQSASEKSVLLESLSRNQQALRDSSEHMSAIVNNAPDAILIVDDTLKIVSCNRAAELIFGRQATNMIHANVSALLVEPSICLAENEAVSVESMAIGAGGKHFPCELSRASFQLSGRARQVLIVRDITERKNMERAKNEFVSIVSHELRTPLTAIRGSLGLLRGGVAGALPKLGTDMIGMAYENTERLARMINDLLDMQKMEAGMMEFDYTTVKLLPLLQSAVASNEPYATQCGVSIALMGEIPKVSVRVDEGRFQQVMSNLISNACKFSPQNSVVEVHAGLIDGKRVKINIIDHGQGIPPEFRSKMFQRFAQADSSDTRKKGGTGLGLSITRDIVMMMEGTIDYESTPGQGTTFFVTLPLVNAN